VDRHAVCGSFTETVVKRASAVRLTAIRNRVDAKRAHDRRESADMIAVGNLST